MCTYMVIYTYIHMYNYRPLYIYIHLQLITVVYNYKYSFIYVYICMYNQLYMCISNSWTSLYPPLEGRFHTQAWMQSVVGWMLIGWSRSQMQKNYRIVCTRAEIVYMSSSALLQPLERPRSYLYFPHRSSQLSYYRRDPTHKNQAH